MTILRGNSHSEGAVLKKQSQPLGCHRRERGEWLTGGDSHTPHIAWDKTSLGAGRAMLKGREMTGQGPFRRGWWSVSLSSHSRIVVEMSACVFFSRSTWVGPSSTLQECHLWPVDGQEEDESDSIERDWLVVYRAGVVYVCAFVEGGG